MIKSYRNAALIALLLSTAPSLAQSVPIKDANGNTVSIRAPNANGQAAAASSAPVTLSTENLTTLGSLFKAGQLIGNTGFNVTGQLPGFAVTPTFNLGTIAGVATEATQQSVLAALQAAPGSIPAGSALIGSTLGLGTVSTAAPTYTPGANAALSLDAAGNLRVTGGAGGGSVPTGTAGSPNAAVLSIQGVSGGTPQPIVGTVAVSNFPASSGLSATASATAPTYTAGSQPLSTDLAGNLRVTAGGAGVAGTPSPNVVTIQGTSGMTPLAVTNASLPLPLNAATDATVAAITTRLNSALPVLRAADTTATGTIGMVAGGSANFAPAGASTVVMEVTGTWSGTLTPQSVNGTTTANITVLPISVGSTYVPAITANGLYEVAGGGKSLVQLTGTAGGTGTANIRFIGSSGTTIVSARSGNPLNFAVSAPTITTGGSTPFHYTSTASTNSTLVAAGAHTLYTLSVTGLNSTAAYVRVYDSATAPNCASATGAAHTYPVLGSATVVGGMVIPMPMSGEAYVNGISFCISGGAADTDNTAAPAGVIVNASYK